MDLEIRIDGKVAVKIELNPSLLRSVLHGTLTEIPKSTPMTPAQVEELLSRIDVKSAQFLRQIAANSGAITWGAARTIFGITAPEDWTAFSAAYGKGITRAVRNVLGDKSARLVWWVDEDEQWETDIDSASLHVDGPALQSLRVAGGTSA